MVVFPYTKSQNSYISFSLLRFCVRARACVIDIERGGDCVFLCLLLVKRLSCSQKSGVGLLLLRRGKENSVRYVRSMLKFV